MNLHGVPRLTIDLDIIVNTDTENLNKLITALKITGFSPRLPIQPNDLLNSDCRQEWVEKRNLIAFCFESDEKPASEVDIVLQHPLVFKQAFKNRTIIKLSDYDIPVVSIEDLQEMKRIAARAQDESDFEMLERIKNEKEDG